MICFCAAIITSLRDNSIRHLSEIEVQLNSSLRRIKTFFPVYFAFMASHDTVWLARLEEIAGHNEELTEATQLSRLNVANRWFIV